MKKASFLLIILLPIVVFAQKDDVLLTSMKEELARNFAAAKKESPAAYYMSYYVQDNNNLFITASLGDIKTSQSARFIQADVDARVGSRRLDNTHEIKNSKDTPYELATYKIPLDADPKAIKNALWRATQAAIKTAQDRYAKVKTNYKTTAKSADDSPDFSPAPKTPAQYYAPITFTEHDIKLLEAKAKKYSALMKEYPFILGSGVSFEIKENNRYIVTTEGASVVEGQNISRLRFTADTRNKDGMELSTGKIYNLANGMPDDEAMIKDIRAALENLRIYKDAPVIDPVSVPVILKAQAAGVFVHEIFGHRAEGFRQKLESSGQTFTKQLGQLVSAPIISIVDDPSLSTFNGRALYAYKYDDEATPAQKAVLIENGVLKGFLMDRNPIKGFPQSNGHGRKELGYRAVARMANTIVSASENMPYEDLRLKLKEEIKKQNKPFGLIIEELDGGFTLVERDLPQSFTIQSKLSRRVYPDDRPDEIVRGLRLIGTPLSVFKNIIAAADDPDIFYGSCGADSGWVPVTAVSPSLLFSAMETEKVPNQAQTLPILPNPAGGVK